MHGSDQSERGILVDTDSHGECHQVIRSTADIIIDLFCARLITLSTSIRTSGCTIVRTCKEPVCRRVELIFKIIIILLILFLGFIKSKPC